MKHLICNHKNKLTYNEMKQYCEDLKKVNFSAVNFIVCPSLPYIYNFIDYKLGAQDISSCGEETLTGDVTGSQLKSLKVEYVIIGHPERRDLLNEDLEIIIKKIKQANDNDIQVIYCLTENEIDLDSAKRTIEKDYESVKNYLKEDVLIAYEPRWAIGNNVNIDYSYINEIIEFIKSKTNKDVIYGGGVGAKNIAELLKIKNINGFLLSNSSLNWQELQYIIDKIT